MTFHPKFRTMKKAIPLLICIISFGQPVFTQNPGPMRLSLQDAIDLATDSSLNAFIAENRYYAGYWNYRNFRTQKLPFLNFNSTPLNFNRSVTQQYNFLDSSYYYVEQQLLSASGNLSLNQTITKTGGRLYLDSDLGYLDNLNKNSEGQFSSTPVRIGYNQQLFGYNPYKWLNKIEPVRYEKAKKALIEDMETIALRAVAYFFSAMQAEINLNIATTRFANADTLYSIGLKRSEIASITREDLLSLQLDRVNAENDLERARTDLKRARMNLHSLLRLPNSLEIELILPGQLPDLKVEPEHCLELAKKNNPAMIDYMQQRLEANREVERAKRSSQFSTDLNASFGLNQQANKIGMAYRDPLDQEIVRVGLSIPLIDWGLSKGQYHLAERQKQVTELSLQQAEIDFEQQVLLTAEEFNQQDKLVSGAAQADTIASLAYDVTRDRFLMGYVDLVRLGVAQTAEISAKRSYIDALQNYWNYFYTIRRMTLYDFVKGEELGHDLLK